MKKTHQREEAAVACELLFLGLCKLDGQVSNDYEAAVAYAIEILKPRADDSLADALEVPEAKRDGNSECMRADVLGRIVRYLEANL